VQIFIYSRCEIFSSEFSNQWYSELLGVCIQLADHSVQAEHRTLDELNESEIAQVQILSYIIFFYSGNEQPAEKAERTYDDLIRFARSNMLNENKPSDHSS
jgi:hypothetical protein